MLLANDSRQEQRLGGVVRFRRTSRRSPILGGLRAKATKALIAAILAAFGIAGYVSVGGSGEFRLCGRTNQQTCVVDGDTIHYQGLKIRLADIDTPEVSQPKCPSEAALGKQATHRLIDLLNQGPFEIAHRSGPDEDRYGRKLRTIEREGRSV